MMNIKKCIILGFSIVLTLVAIVIFFISGGASMFSKKSSAKLSEIIKQENWEDLELNIYYISPFIFTRAPLSVVDLVRFNNAKQVVVNGNNLMEYVEALNQISDADLIPVENKSQIDARLYYAFETKKGKNLFDVAMWGDGNSIFVNGVEVKGEDVFYNVITPFMPDDAVEELETYIGIGKN